MNKLNRHYFLEYLILLFVFVGAFIFAFNFALANSSKFAFYQKYYGPAVNFACGGHFSVLSPENLHSLGLQKFLHNRTTKFQCENFVGKSLAGASRIKFSPGMILTAAALWRMLSPNWLYIYVVASVFFAIAAIFIYAIFRLFLPKVISLLFSFMLIFGTNFLGGLPERIKLTLVGESFIHHLLGLRDFMVAPFFFSIILIVGYILQFQLRKKVVSISMILLGLLFGVGYLFRPDILVLLPLVMVWLIYLLKRKYHYSLTIIGYSLLKLFAVFLPFFLLVYFSGWNTDGYNESQIYLQGLGRVFTNKLGLLHSLYLFEPRYNDVLTFNMMSRFAFDVMHYPFPLHMFTPKYNDVGWIYAVYHMLNFPADVIIRMYASFINIITIGLVKFSWVMAVLMGLIVAFFLSMRVLKKQAAWLVTLTIAYLMFYPTTQFDSRHYFYLLVIPFFIIAMSLKDVIWLVRTKSARLLSMESYKGLAIFWSVTAIMITVPLYLARLYQQKNVITMFSRYLSSPKLKITPLKVAGGSNTVSYQIPFIGVGLYFPVNITPYKSAVINSFRPVSSAYIFLKFNQSKQCQKVPLQVRFVYDMPKRVNRAFETIDKPPKYFDNSFQLKTVNRNTSIFFPAYYSYNASFSNITMNKQAANCLQGIYKVKNTGANIKFWPILVLNSGWQRSSLYQRLEAG